MTPRELKRTASRDAVRARIVSDGCRDYVVEVVSTRGAGLLRHRRGKPLRFRNLGEVHRLLERCGVREAFLHQRVADDETAHPARAASFHDVPVSGH